MAPRNNSLKDQNMKIAIGSDHAGFHHKEMLKERLISEDDDRRAKDEIQKLTDRHVHEIDQVLAEKEKELLQV